MKKMKNALRWWLFVSAILIIALLMINEDSTAKLRESLQDRLQNKFQISQISNGLKVSSKIYLSNQSSIIYRLYLDYRTSTPFVHILMFRRCMKISPTFSMQIKLHRPYKADIVLTNLWIETDCSNKDRWMPNCHWLMHRVSAKIPALFNTLDEIKGVTLIRQDNSSLDVPASKILVIPPTDSPRMLLAVCVAPIYLTTDWLQLVQFIEIWRSQGAEKIIIYYQSVSATVLRFLRAYESENVVELVPWSPLPTDENTGFDPNIDQFRIGQDLAENDCMYRTAEMAKFVAKVDLDEFIIPHSGVLVDFLETTLLSYPNACLFHFSPQPIVFDKQPRLNSNGWQNPKLIDFSYLTSSFYESKTQLNKRLKSRPEKTIILPRRTDRVLVHSAMALQGFKNVAFDLQFLPIDIKKNVSYFHQRYDLKPPVTAIIRSSHPLSSETAAAIQKNYDFMIEKHFAATFNLSVDYDILEIIGKCWRTYDNAKGCRAPTSVCFDQVKNLTEWVFVVENSFFLL